MMCSYSSIQVRNAIPFSQQARSVVLRVKAAINELVTLGHLPEIRPLATMESCSYRQITESRGNFCEVVGLLAS